MSVAERRSALAAHPLFAGEAPAHGAEHAVTITERRPLAILQVSAFAATVGDAGARLSAALALALPAANRAEGDSIKSLRATGPGIWQVVGVPSQVPHARALREALAGVATVVDLGHARTALQVAGRHAARTLAKHCGLDLDPARFPTGSATNTRFGHLGITVARLDDAPTFELLLFRGYAEFAFEELVESASEFGVAVIAQQ
jgi:sarcosine oxidase subunit gamma